MRKNYISASSSAHHRLIYDEFFFFQLGMAIKKSGRILEKGIQFKIQGTTFGENFSRFYLLIDCGSKKSDQRNTNGYGQETAMNRLLQGDVGSGKTIVSMAAMITACENSYQAAIMAPTEILAKQHYQNIKNWASALGLNSNFTYRRSQHRSKERSAEQNSKRRSQYYHRDTRFNSGGCRFS